MDNTELRKFISLFDAWYDAVDLAIQWQKEDKELESSRLDNIEVQLNLIKSYNPIPLLNEIKNNLYQLKEGLDRESYLREILLEFVPLYIYFSPTSIDENEINPSIPVASIVPGKNIINMIWRHYLRTNEMPDNYLLQYIIKCCCLCWAFIERLDIICIGLGIDIEYIQNKYEIRIRKERNYNPLEIDGGFSFSYVREIEEQSKKSISLPQKRQTKKSAKQKAYKSFEDIFVSKDAYAKAIIWLEEKNYFVNGIFVLNKDRFPELFRALELKGYIISTLSIRTKESISKLIHPEGYSKSRFSDKQDKDLDYTITRKPKSYFHSLPQYVK